MDDVNVLVTFYSRYGSTERLAVWIAEGAVQAGAKIRLRRARDLAPEEVVHQVPEWKENRDRMQKEYAAPTEADAKWADAIILGTPCRFGAVSAELKAYLDSLDTLWSEGKLNGKVGSAFTSSYAPQLGSESTLLSMYQVMAHLGLTMMPIGRFNRDPAAEPFELAHLQGKTVTQIARALRAAGT
ncbi:MAG: NAD(P)H-dependent oxidoreductase [Acidobacteriaceae bacterium]|nr:NAD(P)H-dependent oxidoreductase [Acidobacteriaceae bacterium]